jgi:hypothetical protein
MADTKHSIIIPSDKPRAAFLVLDTGRKVPMAEVTSVGQDWVEKVIWEDGSWSWAKSWQMQFGDHFETVRIGAGAYGNMTIWERK